MVTLLSVEELECKLRESTSIKQYKRWHVILMRSQHPEMNVKEIANICQVKYRTVTQWWWMYNTQGPEKMILSARSERHHSLLSKDEEVALLNSMQKKAEEGQIVTAHSIKQAIEEKVGHTISKGSVYNILHRNNWRKIMPHTHHPKSDKSVQESFKKIFQTR